MKFVTSSAKRGLIAFPNSQLCESYLHRLLSYHLHIIPYNSGIYVRVWTKFQDSTKFTSQVMGFQICAIGISYKNPFHRAGHIFAISNNNCPPSLPDHIRVSG